MQHLAGDQPGDGLQPDVGVRADVEAGSSVTSAGPMWSAKHQAPTVRRPGGAAPAAPASTADGGLAAGRDLDAGGLGRARPHLGWRGVNGADRAAHSRNCAPL